MQVYIFTTQILTTGSIVEAAKSFEIGDFEFKEATNQAPHSCLYYISFPIKASDWRVALKRFNAKMITLEDALAFYYCMPVIWQWWNFSITRRNDPKKRIVVSLYKTEDGVVMSDYDDPPAASILKIMDKIEGDRQFANSLYFHGALCRLDSLEFTRSHLPAMFQLVESVAGRRILKDASGKSYKAIDHSDAKKMLGGKLHKTLYSRTEGRSGTVRNEVMHGGNSNARTLRYISHGHIEDVMKQVRKRLIETNDLADDVEVGGDRVDIIRYFFDRQGGRWFIKWQDNKGLEQYYEEFSRGSEAFLKSVDMERNIKNW
jgi:hypothetical protein